MLDESIIDRAIAQMGKGWVNYEYFFGHLTLPVWIRPLHKRGMFQKPPAPEIQGDYISFPFWPESQYLARMASKAPELVMEIVLQIPDSENWRVNDDLADAALAMPAQLSVKLLPKLLGGMNSPYRFLFSEKVGELVSHLTKNGEVESGVDLARKLLTILCGLDTASTVGSAGVPGYGAPQPPDHDLRTLERIIKNDLPPLVDAAGIAVVSLLADLLEKALVAYGEPYRQAIEKDERIDSDIGNVLITALRDAANACMPAEGQEVLALLAQRPSSVLRRIELHLRRVWPDTDSEGTARLLADADVLSDTDLWHELFLLLQERFADLPQTTQEAYLGFVDRGADVDRGEWVGPTSPKTAEELVAMSVQEMAHFFASWTPSDDWMSPSREGLGRELASVVSAHPQRFAQDAHLFQGLDPTFVRALIEGLRKAVGTDTAFDWEPIIELCLWVVSQPREIPGRTALDRDTDPDWGWTRKAIASLLPGGLEVGTAEIPYALRRQVWRVIEPLTDDPDPTPELEARYSGTSMDPPTLAINSVRGEAMRAVIMFGLWVRKNAVHAEFCPSEDIPEALRVLDHHLDFGSEPCLAIRSVYGQFFPHLDQLDPRWTSEKINKVFPSDVESSAMREAAWSSYIVHCEPYRRMLELLADEYSEAIERIGSTDAIAIRFANPDVHLAQHLMIYYWRGDLCLDTRQGLLARFYGKADDELRAKAMSFVGRSLQSTSGEISPEITARLRALWSARLESIRESPESGQRELAAFGWWFASGKFDDDWSLSQLEEALLLYTREGLEADSLVVERLAELCPRSPQQCLELLQLLLERDTGFGYYAWRNPARTILSTALTKGDDEVAQIARKLVNRLGTKGILEYRDLLPG